MTASDAYVDGEGSSTSPPPDVIRLTIQREYYLLPGFMATAGATIGLFRGTRTASLQFLAENAHRAPTTLQGWYFYNKTKNYRMILGGLRQGGVDGIRMGLTGLGWVGFEEGMRRTGLDEMREVGAGIGTAGTFSAVCEWRRVGDFRRRLKRHTSYYRSSTMDCSSTGNAVGVIGWDNDEVAETCKGEDAGRS